MIQEIKGRGHQVTLGGNVIVCHGGIECPLRRSRVPQSAHDELEFKRLTGIRTGSYRVRELLDEFRARHNLVWRGRGIARMWKHRTLEYDDIRDCLRLNPSLASLTWGWICTLAVGTFLMLLAWIIVTGSKSPAWDDWVKVGMAFSAYALLFYICVEHMVVPEAMARRLRKVERREDSGEMQRLQQENQSA